MFLFIVHQRNVSLVAAAWRWAGQERHVVPRRPDAEGARLQLAQRLRFLDRRAAGHRRRRRRGDFVSWATNLVYRAVGDTPPPPAVGRGAGLRARRAGGAAAEGVAAPRPRPRRGPAPRADTEAQIRQTGERASAGTTGRAAVAVQGVGTLIDTAIALVVAGEPEWTILTVRPPASTGAPVTVMADRGDGGQPQLRSTVTVDSRTMAVSRWERFHDQSAGRRARSFFRFAHTGEYAGLIGQTLAGIASAAGAMLVYSGLALSVGDSRRGARESARVVVGQTQPG